MKLGNFRFSTNSIFGIVTRSHTYMIKDKTTLAFAGNRRELSAVFLLSCMTLNFEKRGVSSALAKVTKYEEQARANITVGI